MTITDIINALQTIKDEQGNVEILDIFSRRSELYVSYIDEDDEDVDVFIDL